MKGLYIHIPYCEYICTYCDFIKCVPKNESVIDEYLEVLIKEINANKSHFSSIKTIYIGGGTPSILTLKQLDYLLSSVVEIKPIEFTIEINPDSYEEEKGKLFKKYGVNRISIGVQSFDENVLLKLGRKHTNKNVFDTIDNLISLGINNINLDMMFAIPNQSIESIKHDLSIIKNLNITHISYYSLILEKNTYFYWQYKHNQFTEVDEDLSATSYELITSKLNDMGLIQYEISNYCKDNKKSLHNLIYWTMDEYIGVGLGAHGFINNTRTINNRIMSKYLKETKYKETIIKHDELLSEEMIFGLRKNDGVLLEMLKMKYNIDILEKFPELNNFINDGLLEITNNSIRLTNKGRLLGNQVFMVFI